MKNIEGTIFYKQWHQCNSFLSGTYVNGGSNENTGIMTIDKKQWANLVMNGAIDIANCKTNEDILWRAKMIKMAMEKLIGEVGKELGA